MKALYGGIESGSFRGKMVTYFCLQRAKNARRKQKLSFLIYIKTGIGLIQKLSR